MPENINNNWIEIAYVSSNSQKLIRIKFQEMTAEQAIERSGILNECDEIDLAVNKVGIFGEKVRLSKRLNPGDRVEIYRALLLNPKEARRMRAQSANQK